MSNPFFSGRIPKDLDERIKQYIGETGESKTDILINALAKYLDYPIKKATSNLLASEERFKLIEERLEALEEFIKKSQTSVISPENFVIKNKEEVNTVADEHYPKDFEELQLSLSNSDNADNLDNKNDSVIASDNKFDNITDEIEHKEDLQTKNGWADTEVDKKTDNTLDNKADTEVTTLENKEKEDNNQQLEILTQSNTEQSSFESLTSVEFVRATGVLRRSLDDSRTKVRNKYRKLGQPLPEKQLLTHPEKIPFKNPFIIQNHPYELFFLGQNSEGNNLWSAYPYDNEKYQLLSAVTTDLEPDNT